MSDYDVGSRVDPGNTPDQQIDQAKSSAQSVSNTNTPESQAPPPDPTKETKPKPRSRFDRFVLRESTLLALMQTPLAYILLMFALMGEITVLFAPPNTGKTLLALALLAKSIVMGMINPADVYYINADDSQVGLWVKTQIAEKFGFNMLAPWLQGFDPNELRTYLEELITSGLAPGKIMILDTGKKFFDPMSKEQSSSFMNLLRQFTMAGGSVIMLAHTNKRTRSDGTPIPGGTSDVLDDCDAAYTLRTVPGPTGAKEKRVVVECIKSRGGPTGPFGFAFHDDGAYLEKFDSVRKFDPKELEGLEAEPEDDGPFIEITKDAIVKGFTTKMILRDEVSRVAEIPKLQALKIIERYTGTDPTRHHWRVEVGRHGSNNYILLEDGSSDDSGVY